jgi:glycosyltransferase involved in cell wall biosynthesis
MRIGIDARLYGLEHAGIGRYVMHLVQELQQLDTTNEYILFLRQDDYDTLKFPVHWTKVLADVRHYTLKEQLTLPRLIRSAHVDLMHFPHFNVPLFYRQPFVVTIHDLLWHEFKGFNVTTLNPLIYFLKYGGYRLVVNHALVQARHILVPSFWVRQKLIDQFSLPGNKISVTYEGIAATFSTKISSPKPKVPLVVYTGSAYPHKNLRLLFDAVKLINRQGTSLNLTVVSSRSVFLEDLRTYVRREGLDQYVSFVGFLNDQDLRLLYSQAAALVHPSLSEGFGLTGLEAMAAGLPVLASRAGSLPEIYQDAALYFDPQDVTDLVDKLKQLLTDPQLAARLRAAGKKLTQTYSWTATAQKTLQVYETSLSLRSDQ